MSLSTSGSERSRAPRWARLAAASAVAFGLAAVFASTARAAPNPEAQQCLENYTAGQRLRRSGALQQAAAAFAHCGSAACPSALHPDCSRWLDEVEAAVPTGVFRVSTPDGTELDGVTMSVDGGAGQLLDGRAVSFDPGEHTLAFTSPGYRRLERRFTFIEGEKLVQRNIALEPLAAPSRSGARSSQPLDAQPASPERASLLPAWIGAGVAVLGTAGFVYFGSSARRDDRALSECAPNCTTERVERIEQQYLLANVSLGVGIAGAVGAVAWVMFRPTMGPDASGRAAGVSLAFGRVTSVRMDF
jgi:hypothetical protein